MNHLDKHNLIKGTQHGFRQNLSCSSNLLDFLNFATKNIDEGEPIDIVYFDFSKAFDKVSITKLLIKLKAYGINGNILNWIEKWLKGRKQCTVLNGAQSEWSEVLS